jgi:hypothetical protein
MRLVATGLSTPGYVTVATVMGLENVLDQAEGFRVLFDRERGRDPVRRAGRTRHLGHRAGHH